MHESGELARLRSLGGVKWTKYGPEVLPAWVADMDFDQAPAVKAAVTTMVERGDLGYNFDALAALAPTWRQWVMERHGLELPEDELWPFTGALHALEAAMVLHTKPGDGIVLFTPIYYPFRSAIEDSGRRVVDVPLHDGWRLDADDFEAAVTIDTKVVLFSQPHNPTGRVFGRDELEGFADVVERHNLLVISDEVWADLTHEPLAHLPLVQADERLLAHTVTLGSASKAFNVSGLRCAVAHVGPVAIRRAFQAFPIHLLGGPSTLSAAATVAAWTDGADWLAATMALITENRDHVAARLAAEIPMVGYDVPEATYLAWLDFRDTTLGDDPAKTLLKQAGVALDQGHKFGHQGIGHARLNFATHRSILDQILDRIVGAVQTGAAP